MALYLKKKLILTCTNQCICSEDEIMSSDCVRCSDTTLKYTIMLLPVKNILLHDGLLMPSFVKRPYT